jgi:hypothetical protein
MTKQQILQAELKSARKRVEALPAWRRAALDRARAAEIELGYIRVPSTVDANEPAPVSALTSAAPPNV